VDVKVYTTSWCGYCRSAKALLKRKGVAFEEIDCTRDPDTRLWLMQQSGMRTVPQIFIDGVPVGGFDDIAALDEDGTLDRILAGEEQPQHV
jgi:glutaredoxin 3